MARIKSALEIALERTESIKSDKSSISQYEAKQKGKSLANSFLEGKTEDLGAEIKKSPEELKENLKQGLFDVFVSQISLPQNKDDNERLKLIGNGLSILIGDKQFDTLFGQLVEVLSRFLDDIAQFDEEIHRQYAPKLRQKEEELSRRLGQQVQLDPFQDPEFANYYQQNLSAMKGNYQSAVDQVREQAALSFNKDQA